MRKIILSALVVPALAMAGCQSTTQGRYYSVHQNTALNIGPATDLHEDCTPKGQIFITITSPPAHGIAYTKDAIDYPHYVASNALSVCNKQKVKATQLWYKPDTNYVGPDSFAIRVQYPEGIEHNLVYPIQVK